MTKKEADQNKNKKVRYRQLNALQQRMRLKFKNKSLLNRALTHRSFVNEIDRKVMDNERLEYLGDSVLALIVNEYLFKHFEDYREGSLAKIKSAAVSETTLAKAAKVINLGSFIHLGKGEEMSGGKDRPSILANTLEAVIGAVYLDQGLKESRKFVLYLLKPHIEQINKLTYLRDPKTTLQEHVQKKYKKRPEYIVVEEKGPDHNKEFIVKLVINEVEISTGKGSSKRRAEMDAATIALNKIENGESI